MILLELTGSTSLSFLTFLPVTASRLWALGGAAMPGRGAATRTDCLFGDCFCSDSQTFGSDVDQHACSGCSPNKEGGGGGDGTNTAREKGRVSWHF